MRVTFEIELRRPARRSLALLLGLLLLAVPGVALAAHQFPDVPDTHPFHNEIGAIAEAGITGGFSDGTYRAGDPVSRQAMAAFMHRGLGRVGLAMGNAPMTSSVAVDAGRGVSSFVPVRQLTITVPGASNAFSPRQLVHLQGRVHFSTSMSGTIQGCPCELAALIRDMNTGNASLSQRQTFESSSSGNFHYSVDVEALFAARPGTRTYQLEAALTSRSSTTNAVSFGLDVRSSLSAMTFPFGPAGTNGLSTAADQNVVPVDDQRPSADGRTK